MRCRRWRRHKAKTSLFFGVGALEPVCRDDPWAALDQLLDEVRDPPFSEHEKAELRALASGESRLEIARQQGATTDVVEARIKKNLERLRFVVEHGKSSGSGG
jgi:hypothetical protein